ncbi:winged helix DNA-binding protein [Aquicoccus sp. SCR17]|nr:winged helix DNA-binding protein [Carideicomes alvinocaridis]
MAYEEETPVFTVPLRKLSARLGVLVQREVLRPAGLRMQEWRVLWSLAQEGPTHLRNLARRADVDPAHVSRLIGRFEEQELAERVLDPEDGRRTLISITASGRALFDRVRPASDRLNADFRSLYTEEEFDLLLGLVQRATDHAERLIAEDARASARPSDLAPGQV